ncbi:MAG: hypothetical protein V3U89_03195 [Methylophilaceae bacterium]
MNKTNKHQHGAALMLLVFILAIAMTSYLVRTLNSASYKVDHEQKVMQNLATAKEALIAWAVSNELHPGQFPYPDHLEVTTPIYDGKGDCGGNPLSNPILLLGQLPVYGSDGCTSPVEGLGIDAQDGYGNRLWYAVSPNLVHNYAPTLGQLSDPIINPSIINTATWLRVVDRNGATISDRVAAVIIAPGNAIGNKSRSNTATVDNFLDEFQIGATSYSNRNYDSFDEDFIIGDTFERVDDDDATYSSPYLFNDKLVYITIDELMVALEKRVAREVVSSLNGYFSVNSYYPYAASSGGTVCVNNQLLGALPLSPCSTPDLSTYLPGWFEDNEWEAFMFYAASLNCSQPNPGCSSGTLKVGTKENLNAVVISTGAEITTAFKVQDRVGSGLIVDYLDSVENISINEEYDAVGTPLTNLYNDQMFIVTP